MVNNRVLLSIVLIAIAVLGCREPAEDAHIGAKFDTVQESKTQDDDTQISTNVDVRTDEESIGRGKVLFEALCSNCHNVHSSVPYSSSIPLRGPGLKGLLKRSVLPISKKPATAESILDQLNKSFGVMPSFHFLSEDVKLNIIAYLNTL
jgi:mono/diheme cytochrome c family protein